MSESIILTDEELQQLTGCKKKSLQIKWLKENRFQFHVNLLGKPVILRSTINNNSAVQTENGQEPDFGALYDG